MKIIKAHNVYSIILNELEWYAVTDAAQASTIALCKEAAQREDCKYAAILVEPDAIMSVSPIPHRHKVWGHTFETDAYETFRRALEDALEDAKYALSHPRMAAIVKEVFGL